MTRRRLRGALLVAYAVPCLGVGLAGCRGGSTIASAEARDAVDLPTTTTTTLPQPRECTPDEKAAYHDGESVAPDRSLAPGELPGGAVMGRILARGDGGGRLVVGVDENTPHFGVRGDDGQLQGLEIELVRAIARAIWPDAANIDDHIQWKTVVTDEKIPFVQNGTVDMTASVVTMNCDRARVVDFSTSYFTTPQKVMVRADSEIRTLADLAGQRVCVTAGSTTFKLLPEDAVVVPVEARTDCLVELQEGRVDAIATHDTILRGLDEQEGAPTRILEEDLKASNYGIAMQKEAGAPFVRFVNEVLEQLRADGGLAELYRTFLADGSYTPPPVPAAIYKVEP